MQMTTEKDNQQEAAGCSKPELRDGSLMQRCPDQDMNKTKYIKIARVNKDRLSDQFMLVNNKYKNEGLKGLKK